MPMEIDSIQRRNMTTEEKEKCRREGRCFHCQEIGHLSRTCPNKNYRRNEKRVNAIEEEEEGKE